MAKCAVCGKAQVTGCNVSHSHVRTKRTWKPNLQKVKTLWKGKVQTITVCTKCLKARKVQRVV
jgi:large subunit ribosomal protein L28